MCAIIQGAVNGKHIRGLQQFIKGANPPDPNGLVSTVGQKRIVKTDSKTQRLRPQGRGGADPPQTHDTKVQFPQPAQLRLHLNGPPQPFGLLIQSEQLAA